MGFFSSLMSQKLLGAAAIKFHEEDKASVEYEIELSDKEQKKSDSQVKQKHNKSATIGLILSIIAVFGVGLAGIIGFILGIVVLA